MLFDPHVFWSSLPFLLQGTWTTIVVVCASMAVGIIIGVLLCAGMVLGSGLIRVLSFAYVSLFRTLPETVLVFWIFYCIPLVASGRPTAFQSAVAALAIPAAANFAEIFRAGVIAVPRGHVEAAHAMGLSRIWVFLDVVAPQASRIIVPPFFGAVTILIKNSALVSIIGVQELFYHATVSANQNYHYIEIMTGAALIYFMLILPLSMLVQWQEQRLLVRNR